MSDKTGPIHQRSFQSSLLLQASTAKCAAVATWRRGNKLFSHAEQKNGHGGTGGVGGGRGVGER